MGFGFKSQTGLVGRSSIVETGRPILWSPADQVLTLCALGIYEKIAQTKDHRAPAFSENGPTTELIFGKT